MEGANTRPPQGYSCPSRVAMSELVLAYNAREKRNPFISQQFAFLANEIIWRHKGDDEAADFFRYLRHDIEKTCLMPLPTVDNLCKK